MGLDEFSFYFSYDHSQKIIEEEIRKDLGKEKIKYLNKIAKTPLMQKRVRWTRSEHVRLLNGMMHQYDNGWKFIYIYSDIVYGFYLARPLQNALSDSWKVILQKKIYKELGGLLNEAFYWAPDTYPLEEHLKGVDKSDSLYKTYERGYNFFKERFKPVTVDNLREFLDKCFPYLRNKISSCYDIISFNIDKTNFKEQGQITNQDQKQSFDLKQVKPLSKINKEIHHTLIPQNDVQNHNPSCLNHFGILKDVVSIIKAQTPKISNLIDTQKNLISEIDKMKEKINALETALKDLKNNKQT